ncbi:MAG: hypothetical protein ACKVJE_17935 [Pseudomonadales bacterium]
MRRSIEVLSSSASKFYLTTYCYYLAIVVLTAILCVIGVMLIGNVLVITGVAPEIELNTFNDFIDMLVALACQFLLFLLINFVRNNAQDVSIDKTLGKLKVGCDEFSKGDIKYVRELIIFGFSFGLIHVPQRTVLFIPKHSLFGLLPIWLHFRPRNQCIKKISTWRVS